MTVQLSCISKQTESIAIRNIEIQRALDDVIALIAHHRPGDKDAAFIEMNNENCMMFKKYYCKVVYKAILAATKKSFESLKRRLATTTTSSFFALDQPFFNVGIELKVMVDLSMDTVSRVCVP